MKTILEILSDRTSEINVYLKDNSILHLLKIRDEIIPTHISWNETPTNAAKDVSIKEAAAVLGYGLKITGSSNNSRTGEHFVEVVSAAKKEVDK